MPTKPTKLPALFEDAAEHLHTLRDLLRFSVSRFNEADLCFGHGTDNAFDEAAYLLLHALDLPRDRLDPFLDALLLDSEKHAALTLIHQRIATRKPAAYLTGEWWIGPYSFIVSEDVLVPRSFIGELLLATEPLGIQSSAKITRVLDVCTGGGSLAILAAYAFPNASVDAVDISFDALRIAHANVEAHSMEGRVFPIESDMFKALKGQKYDLIISNPPYVDAASMAELPDEYRAEPQIALASGEDGLSHTHTLLRDARNYLSASGKLVVEIGHNRNALEAAYPKLPFLWLPTASGNNFVFALTASQLKGKA